MSWRTGFVGALPHSAKEDKSGRPTSSKIPARLLINSPEVQELKRAGPTATLSEFGATSGTTCLRLVGSERFDELAISHVLTKTIF